MGRRTHRGRGAALSITALVLVARLVGVAPVTVALRTKRLAERGVDVAAAGSAVLAFGDAPDEGSLAGNGVNSPIVDMAATPSGHGYWLVGADGGIFAFGDAGFYGSTGNIHLDQPIVGIAPTPTGKGYWLTASDGGIFAFGDAGFHGSTGNVHLAQPIVGIARSATGRGYWLAASDGGIFAFGDAGFHGSAGGQQLAQGVVAIAATPDGAGYWLAEGQKQRSTPFTPALVAELNARPGIASAAVLDLRTGQLYQYNPGLVDITASIVKVQILGTLLQDAQRAGTSLSPADQALAVPMIEESDNNAASALYSAAGGPGGVLAFDRSAGLLATVPGAAWGFTTTTAQDQSTLIDHLAVANPVLSDASRAYALGLMEHVTPSQAWGVSAGVAPGVSIALKNGWLPFNGEWIVNSIGWIDGAARDYVIAVLTDHEPTEADGIATISDVAAASFAALGS
jgi:beta-lactamase class A